MTRKVLIPLDLASPTTDPVSIRHTMDWVKESIVQSGDELTLLTVIPTNLSSFQEKMSRALVGVMEFMVHEKAGPDMSDTDDLLLQNTRHKLTQYSNYLQCDQVSVQTMVERNGDALKCIKETIDKLNPNVLIIYDRKSGNGKSIAADLQRYSEGAAAGNILCCLYRDGTI